MNVKLYYKIKSAQYKQAQVTDLYLKTDASDSSDINVFMMEVLPLNALHEQDSVFSHIATPNDMQQYPAEYTRDYPYYRTHNAVLRLGTINLVQNTLTNLNQDLKRLNKAVTMLQQSDSESYLPVY